MRIVCQPCQTSYAPGQALASGGLCPRCRAPLSSLSENIAHSHYIQPASSTTSLLQEAPDLSTDTDWVTLQVLPVKGEVCELNAITQLVNALGRSAAPLSFEIAGADRRRFLLVRCRAGQAAQVRGRLTALYGSPEVEVLDLADDPFRAGEFSCLHFRLQRPAGLPLRGYQELADNDTLRPVLAALFDLGEGEAAGLQVIVHGPAPKGWAAGYRRELLSVQRRQSGVLAPAQAAGITALAGGIGLAALGLAAVGWGVWSAGIPAIAFGLGLSLLGVRGLRRSDLNWSQAEEGMVAAKLAMPAYQVEVRAVAAAADPARQHALLDSLAGALGALSVESGNALEPGRLSSDPAWPLSAPEIPRGPVCLLGDAEIAALWHLPVAGLPDMLESRRVRHVLPDMAAVSAPGEGWYLGQARKSAGTPIEVWLPRETITRTHALLLGRTRMGKSNTLAHMIREAAADPGRSVVVIDPHDDMAADLLGLMPAERADEVLYLDFGDSELRPAFNPLDVSLFDGDAEACAAAFQEVAHALYQRFWGPRMEVPFHRAVMAIALANRARPRAEQFTVLDVLAVLQFEPEPRARFLQQHLPDDSPLKDTILRYFHYEFGTLQKAFREQVVMPVLSKLRPFESNSHLLSIFGQPQSSFNLIEAVCQGRILLVRTGAARITREYSDFLGSLLLNLVRKAVFRQSALLPAARRPVTIFIDESQSFSGIDYGEALAEIAKFGGNLVLSTQGAKTIGRSTASDQVDDPHAFSKIMDNVDTMLVFRTSGENARQLAETEFWHELDPTDLIHLDRYQAFVRYIRDGRVVGPFRVHLAGPPPQDGDVRTRILAGRARYLRPVPELLQAAHQALARQAGYFQAEKAAAARPAVPSPGFDAASAAEELAASLPDLTGAGLDFVLGALGDLNTRPADGEGLPDGEGRP